MTTPGVVFALSAAIRTFTEKGDAVLINRPVYYPFSNLIDGLKRRLINSPLQLKDGRYEIDFADVEEKNRQQRRPPASPLQPSQSGRPGLDPEELKNWGISV